jgi:hypothetical protein
LNHYCTYFDRNFLIQGVALAGSLRTHDPQSVLWVLCLDDFTFDYLQSINDPVLRPVPLAVLETADPKLRAARENRTLIEYYFTLSPCWPRYLLQREPKLERITYLDADLFFYASPAALFTEMGNRSVLITLRPLQRRHPLLPQRHPRPRLPRSLAPPMPRLVPRLRRRGPLRRSRLSR